MGHLVIWREERVEVEMKSERLKVQMWSWKGEVVRLKVGIMAVQ